NAATGAVTVEALATLDMVATTIDDGTLTNHGLLAATSGTSTLSNLAIGNFTNDGTIEVDAAAKLLLDTDTLTNKIGAANGTVKADATGELVLKSSTFDQGIVTVDGQLKAKTSTSTAEDPADGAGTG